MLNGVDICQHTTGTVCCFDSLNGKNHKVHVRYIFNTITWCYTRLSKVLLQCTVHV